MLSINFLHDVVVPCANLFIFVHYTYIIMRVRRARVEEIEAIMLMYECAKAYMRREGNMAQWGDDYPPRELILDEICAGRFYAIEHDDVPVGVFSFDVTTEPTYAVVYGGAWRCDEPYGVVHRLASNGRVGGVSDCCFAWCKERHPYLRVDTHRDNLTMQRAIARQGFEYSGVIRLMRNGDERLAYEWHK